MKNIKISLIILILTTLTITGCLGNTDTSKAQKLIDYQASRYNEISESGELVNGIREIKLTATRYFWYPREIIVNKGEKISLTISSVDVPHGFEIEGFNIPDYDINTKIRKGESLTLEFDATKKGSWDILCTIYCGAGHGNMKAKFIIK